MRPLPRGSTRIASLRRGLAALSLALLVLVAYVSAADAATSISAGGTYTCALTGSGAVDYWGGSEGQLGDGTTTDRNPDHRPGAIAIGPGALHTDSEYGEGVLHGALAVIDKRKGPHNH